MRHERASIRVLRVLAGCVIGSSGALFGCTSDPTPADQVRAACEQRSWRLPTEPGQYHAEMPAFVAEDATLDGVRLVQEPAAGTKLKPGPFKFTAGPEGKDPLCVADGEVYVDENTGAAPSVSFTPAHAGIDPNDPNLVIEPLIDPEGKPYTVVISLNGEPIEGVDFGPYAGVLFEPAPDGVHLIDVNVTDALGRKTLFQFSDFAQTNWQRRPLAEVISRIPTWRDKNSGIGINAEVAGCRCALVTTPGDKTDCSQADVNDFRLFGTRVWRSHCSGDESTWLWAWATDRGAGIEDIGKSDQGSQSHDWAIVCEPPGASDPSNCEQCCPNPVIWVEYDMHVPAMTADVQAGWDLDGTARGEMRLSTSGLGSLALHQSAVSGYEQVTTKVGLEAGGTAGKSKEGPSLEVTASVATEVEHTGSTGGAVSKPAQTETATGWKAGQCQVGETRSVALTGKALANGDAVISEKAEVEAKRQSYIRVRRAGFRCDGTTPSSGSAP